MQHRATLTEGAIGPKLVRLTGPMLMGMFAMFAFNLVDALYVSWLGKDQLAAMQFIFPVVMVFGFVALGLGTGAGSVVSRAIGAGDHERVRRNVTDSLILAVALVGILVVVGFTTMDSLFRHQGASGDILVLVKDYMTIWYAGMLCVVIPMVGNHCIRASGDTLRPGLIMLAGAAVNVVLDPIMIFGLFGFPRLEMQGAALATVLSRALTMCLSLYILGARKRMITLTRPQWHELVDSWRRVLSIGLPAAGTRALWPLTMLVMNRFLAGLGTVAVAAAGAAFRVEAFAMMLTAALGSTLIPVVGQNWGAGRYERVREAQGLSCRFSLRWGLACYLILAFVAPLVARLFAQGPEVTAHIVQALRLLPAGYGMAGVCMLVAVSLQAMNKPLVSAALEGARLLVFMIPLAWAGSAVAGFPGLLGGVAIANLLAGTVAWACVRRAVPTREP